MGRWLWTIIFWFCALIFIGIGIYAYKRKSPMNFWSTSTVDKCEINDISSYNRANAIMWIVYGLIFICIGIIGFIGHVDIAGYLALIVTFFGIPILIFIYSRIYKKYKAKS